MVGDKLYVVHILESIAKIESFVAGFSLEKFRKNILVQSGVMRELEIIGEAAKKLSDEFKIKYPTISWKEIAGMRDKLAHDYFEVDPEIVWKTVVEELPRLKAALSNKVDWNVRITRKETTIFRGDGQ